MTCPICQGTGFRKGQICPCITGKKDRDVPKILKDILGRFSTTPEPESEKGSGKRKEAK